MAEKLMSFDDFVTADIGLHFTTFTVGSLMTVTITSSAGRNGTNGLRIARGGSAGGGSVSLIDSVPTAARYVLAFSRQWSTLPPAGESRIIATVRDSGTVQCNLRLNSDGTLQMVRGASTTITGGLSTFTITPGVRYHFEWAVTVHNTAGIGALMVNGVTTAFSFTGQNTRSTSNNQINEVGLRCSPSDTTGDTSFNDDIDDYIWHDTAGFVGDLRVDYRKPTGAGTYSAWTANGAATLWEAVSDAAQDGDTTYASSATVGQKQTFTVEDVPTSAVIKFAQHVWVAKKTDAGTRAIAPRTKSGGSENLGTDLSLGTSYAVFRQSENLDPATGVVWTATGFNAGEIGDEVTV